MAKRTPMKRGPLSDAEKEYASRTSEKGKTIEQIAAHLRRTARSIESYLRGAADSPLPVPIPGRRITSATELENRPEWAHFKAQFTEDELEFFQYQYLQLVNQFGRDEVLPTEEMQIFSVITMGIMISRTLAEQKVIAARMAELSRELETGEQKIGRATLDAEFADCHKTNQSCTDRHNSYTMRQASLLKDLKATREQRVKVVEGSRQSFVGLIKRLMQDEAFRNQVGFEAGSMVVAMKKEKERLAAPHKYEDGVWDQPLLTPDTVLDEYEVPEGSGPT